MSRSHLILAERIGIEVFVAMGMSCRTIAACPGPPPHSTISREPRDRMRRSDLVARTDCEPSAAGLSRGSRYGHQWETICPLELCGRTAWRCRQPSFAPHPPMPQAARQCGRGRGRLLGCIDIARRPQPVAGGSGLRLQGPGSAAQLQGAQKSLSAAGQGPKQNGRRLGRGACSAFV